VKKVPGILKGLKIQGVIPRDEYFLEGPKIKSGRFVCVLQIVCNFSGDSRVMNPDP
jgi:hypothetical protein